MQLRVGVQVSVIDVHVGRRLVAAMDAAKMTPDALATIIGTDPDTVTKYCDGRVRIGPSMLFNICEALDREIKWFFEEPDTMTADRGTTMM